MQLPFDLLTHLEGTEIGVSFGLQSCGVRRHTVVELGRSDTEDLLTMLKALAGELQLRCEKWRRQASRSPIPVHRRTATEQSLQVINSAVGLINAALVESKLPKERR